MLHANSLPAVLATHMDTSSILAALPLIQLPDYGFGKQLEDVTSSWASAPTQEAWRKLLAPGCVLNQLQSL